MPDPRSPTVRLSDGESSKFLANFSRVKTPQRRTLEVFTLPARSAWQCCKINKDRDIRFTRTHTYVCEECPFSFGMVSTKENVNRREKMINKYHVIDWNFN